MVSIVTLNIGDTASTETVSLLGTIATVVLLVLLVARELAAASENPKLQALSRHPYVAIVPLVFVFFMTVIAGLL